MGVTTIFKKIYCIFISFLPVNGIVRARLYNLLPNYEINNNVKIGYGSLINVAKCTIRSNTIIDKFVKIKNVDILYLDNMNVINNFTKIIGPEINYKYTENKFVTGQNIMSPLSRHIF